MTPDGAVLDYVIQLRRPWLDELMVLASALGSAGFIWIIFGAIAGIFPAHTKAMWRLWLALGLSFILVDDVLKPLFDRARPFDVLEIQLIDARPNTPSFPSGHAAMAAAGALAGTRMIPAAGWVLWPFSSLVIISRVYVGTHWPSDVAAGAVIGFAIAWFVLGGRSTVTKQNSGPNIHPYKRHHMTL